ncbi:hypothetical protein DXG01_006926 [Tephrocybe rancida]|nr:hypothetical protein DXG01_006926 [Tephrocybe rancida]
MGLERRFPASKTATFPIVATALSSEPASFSSDDHKEAEAILEPPREPRPIPSMFPSRIPLTARNTKDEPHTARRLRGGAEAPTHRLLEFLGFSNFGLDGCYVGCTDCTDEWEWLGGCGCISGPAGVE